MSKTREAAIQFLSKGYRVLPSEIEHLNHKHEIQIFEAGAEYQAAITREETIAEVINKLREMKYEDLGLNDCTCGNCVADWLEQKLREGKK